MFDIIYKEQFGVHLVTDGEKEEGQETIDVEFVPLTPDEEAYKRELILTYKRMYANKTFPLIRLHSKENYQRLVCTFCGLN